MNPVLHAVLEINPNADSNARKLDEELKSGQSRGPLHGIPVLLKESIGTSDGTETTAGSPASALVGIRPNKEAEVVGALRKAGAVILGKANLSELYWLRGSNIPNGWSGRGGQTRNAYNLNVTPEGFSSGSAVSVAANLCGVAIGTETDRSLIAPSNLAGLFAIKPTFGLVSVKGVIPVSHNQDYVGPMARTASDLAIVLDAMVSTKKEKYPSSFLQYTLNDTMIHFRIGVLRYPLWDTTVINSTNLQNQLPQLENLLKVMSGSKNFAVVDPVELADKELFEQITPSNELTMFLHDFIHDLNEYLKNDVIYTTNASQFISSLKHVIRFNEDHPNALGYNQEYNQKAQATDGITNETYLKTVHINREKAKLFLDSVLEQCNLDAVVTPSDSQPEGISEKSLQDFPSFGFSIACMAGYLSINRQVPAGIGPNQVPFGVTFVGKAYEEHVLLKIAHTMEQISPHRNPPQFLI